MAKRSQPREGTDRKARAGGAAGLFQAEAAYADSIFSTATGDVKGAIAALRRSLTSFPTYAPAVFSLGTVEYQRGNRLKGRRLFHSLLSCPMDTPDLFGLIDHAGDFLIGFGDYEDGLDLYRAAALRFPDVAVFHQGVGCCAGHGGLHEEAIAASRQALELEPGNQLFVNDLGWSLLEAGCLCEAEETLTRAVAMDPDDALARENLRFCKSKVAEQRAKPNKAPQPTAPQRKRRGRG